MPPVAGSAVVVLPAGPSPAPASVSSPAPAPGPGAPSVTAGLPVAALPALRGAVAVYADPPLAVPGAEPTPSVDKLAAQAAVEPVVLLTTDPAGPSAQAMAGADLVPADPAVPAGSPARAGAPGHPPGSALLDAVAVMDRLRSPGGCPWDAEQTHDSLRQYLVEETYELLDAIEHGDRAALLEELGDVLLQVLFHARIAAEDAAAPFTVDDVARSLVDKLVGRHPHVFAGSERLATAGEQEVRWEELKREEKRRTSSVDGVALGQPAVALAAKLVSRTARAGFPVDLYPDGDTTGATLFAVTALAKLAGEDPEAELRTTALRFAAAVRATESAARADGLDPAALTPADWRAHHTP